jgi:hypothetical protein
MPYVMCHMPYAILYSFYVFTISMDISTWLVTLMFVQGFAMFSDVPADGYSVELGQIESKECRGQILATGQRVRFTFCVVAGLIQSFLLNGPTTNDADCSISFDECWSWGLSINAYYGLLFCLILLLTIPVVVLKELDGSHIPQHSLKFFFLEVWETLQNLTTFYLVIFVIAIMGFTNFTSNASIQLQYYVIKLTNFQAGIDTGNPPMYTLHTAYCILHTAYDILHTAYCILHTAHCTLHTAHCI